MQTGFLYNFCIFLTCVIYFYSNTEYVTYDLKKYHCHVILNDFFVQKSCSFYVINDIFVSVDIYWLRYGFMQIARRSALGGASYRRGRTCAIGHAGHVASAATACRLALPATKMSVRVTLI